MQIQDDENFPSLEVTHIPTLEAYAPSEELGEKREKRAPRYKIFFSFNGEDNLTITDAADKYGLNRSSLAFRARKLGDPAQALAELLAERKNLRVIDPEEKLKSISQKPMTRERKLAAAGADLEQSVLEHQKALEAFLRHDRNELIHVAEMMATILKNGGKVLIAGNGGSAADAQHFAAEMTGWYKDRTRKPLAAIALTTDSSALTAISNDSSFDEVFARQVEALGRLGDMFVGISTSGGSPNIVAAAQKAREMGMSVVALTGLHKESGRNSPLSYASPYHLCVPSLDTPRVQECHIWALHEIAHLCESYFL